MQMKPHNMSSHDQVINQRKLKVMVDGRVIEIEVNKQGNLNKTVNLSHEISIDHNANKKLNVRVTGNSSQKNRVVVPINENT